MPASSSRRGTDAPTFVDFTTHVVACVFLGHEAGWPFRIAFGPPRQEPGLRVVPYSLVELVLELDRPYRAGGQYRLAVIPREAGRAVLLAREDAAPGR